LLKHIAKKFSLIHCELLETSHQFLAPNLADTETSCCIRC
jgi:hypothetical protein